MLFINYNNLVAFILLPLFTRGKLRTSKINFGDKIWKKPRLFSFSNGKKTMITSCLASFVNFDTISKLKWNGYVLLHYAIIISVQNLTHVIKSNTAS